MRIVFSGGGTGGHVYPAIAIADAVRKIKPEAEILFIGANGKLEMEKVPQAGYKIEGLNISGFHRKLTLQNFRRNLSFPFKLIASLWKARSILKRFKPDLAIGVGGYASGPTLEMASRMGVPCLIQEQNSYPGKTNRILAKKVQKICVAYDNMEKYFPKEKLVKTGNPIRNVFFENVNIEQSKRNYKLEQNKKTVLLFGGSLGAKSLNVAVAESFELLKSREDIQLIWQAGKLYYDTFRESETALLPNVKILPYLEKMEEAYAAADIVISRAGAITISELAAIGKAAILVPSPNVAEDHQTMNAKALSSVGAAILVEDKTINERLFKEAFALIDNVDKVKLLETKIKSIGILDAGKNIAVVAMSLV